MAIFTAYGWYAIILAAIILCTMFPIIAQVLLVLSVLCATAVAKYGVMETTEMLDQAWHKLSSFDCIGTVKRKIERIPWRDLYSLFFISCAVYSFACSVAVECDPMAQKIAMCSNVIWALTVAWPIACILAEH